MKSNASKESQGQAPRKPAPPIAGRQVAALQRAYGNQAVGQIMAGPPIQRLMTLATFKSTSNAGMLASRGNVLEAIDEKLGDYHTLVGANPGVRQKSPTFLREAGTTLEHLDQNVNLWLEKHEDDTSSKAGKRRPAIIALKGERDQEWERLKNSGENARSVLSSSSQRSGGPNKIMQQYTAAEASSGFEKLGTLIDAAAGQAGQSGEVELGVTIPCGGPVSVALNFKASAERESADSLSCKAEVSVGVEGEAGAAKISGALGGYVEATAKTSQEVTRLFSYSMYRRARESAAVPASLTNKLWGGGTGSFGHKRAERFGASVERDILGQNDNAQVETGGFAQIAAEGGIGPAKVSGKMRGGLGRRYNREAIDRLYFLSKAHNQLTSAERTRAEALGITADTPRRELGILDHGAHALGTTAGPQLFGQAARGEHTRRFQLSGDVAFGAYGGSIQTTFNWASKGRQNTSLEKGAFEAKVKGAVAPGAEMVDTAAEKLNGWVRGAVEQQKAQAQEQGELQGSSVEGEGEFETAFDEAKGALKDKLTEAALGEGGPANWLLTIAVEKKPGSGAEGSVTISRESEREVSLGVAKAKVTTAQRVVRFVIANGGVDRVD